MVKCILGLTASKNLNITNTKPECIDLLFGNINWPEGWGLYFRVFADTPLYHSDSFLIETQVDPARQLILAARFTIRGLPMVLCLSKPDVPENMGLFHPEAIIFRSGAHWRFLGPAVLKAQPSCLNGLAPTMGRHPTGKSGSEMAEQSNASLTSACTRPRISQSLMLGLGCNQLQRDVRPI